jgi:hypothetical protein
VYEGTADVTVCRRTEVGREKTKIFAVATIIIPNIMTISVDVFFSA